MLLPIVLAYQAIVRRSYPVTAKLPLMIGATLALASCAGPSTRIADVAPPPVYETPVARPAAPSAARALAAAAATVTNPNVGGVAMLGTRTIADNCASAPNLRVLTQAMNAGGVRQTLAADGPITVFAPTDAAFGRLADGAVGQLMAPANRGALMAVMRYHVVPGAITLDDLRARIAAGGGTARLTTIGGATLVASNDGTAVALTDVNGNRSYVETPDVQQSNGIVHVVNGVLVPRLG
jgi:uncharacterized surface protein with fasciclin (FAS1) repeats